MKVYQIVSDLLRVPESINWALWTHTPCAWIASKNPCGFASIRRDGFLLFFFFYCGFEMYSNRFMLLKWWFRLEKGVVWSVVMMHMVTYRHLLWNELGQCYINSRLAADQIIFQINKCKLKVLNDWFSLKL